MMATWFDATRVVPRSLRVVMSRCGTEVCYIGRDMQFYEYGGADAIAVSEWRELHDDAPDERVLR